VLIRRTWVGHFRYDLDVRDRPAMAKSSGSSRICCPGSLDWATRPLKVTFPLGKTQSLPTNIRLTSCIYQHSFRATQRSGHEILVRCTTQSELRRLSGLCRLPVLFNRAARSLISKSCLVSSSTKQESTVEGLCRCRCHPECPCSFFVRALNE